MTIGVVDSGIDSDSPEFAGRLSSASRDVAGSRGVDNPDSDHGTNVAMIAAAARDNTGILGIAFGAQVAMFRADSPGSCTTPNKDGKNECTFGDTAIAAGVNAAIDAGAKVINLSLGGSSPGSILRAAVSRAASAGVVVIISAGNDGDSTDPAVDPNNPDPFATGLRAAGNGNVIIAGSVGETNQISAFSNRAGSSAQWYLTARGERVCCVYENGAIKITTDSTGARFVTLFSGTSFSAPQIAGAAALLFQAFPNLTAAQVVDLLLRTGTDAGATGTDATYGRGILNIAAAFAPQGATALSTSTVPLPIGDTTIATSRPMGDARIGAPLDTVLLDGYGRAYDYNLASGVRSAAVAPRLTAALTGTSRTIGGAGGAVAMAFTVDATGRAIAQPWQGALRLSRGDAEAARVLAGQVVARIAPKTSVAFAFAQGADGLVAQLQGRNEAAFFVAGSAHDDVGFDQSNQTTLAVRRNLGTWALTATAARGNAITGSPLQFGTSLEARRGEFPVSRIGVAFDRGFEAGRASIGASWLHETGTVLGARIHSGLGGSGADTMLADAAAQWSPAPGWQLGGALRAGFTRAGSAGTLQGGTLVTSAWSLDALRSDVFAPGDSVALRLSQPLRVESGTLSFLLPIDYSYETLQTGMGLRTLSLAPQGRELDAELGWSGPLLYGQAHAGVFYRKDPGHRAALPDDKGMAVSWRAAF
ncbi:S8 family peptidase [Parablastomonas sp. CN1-191]|uniref:S8 family peptidase n=1 Tax=Parablastomonas sp. CN1-191 TaxID=3400908 RepID=UPI003BF7D249